MQVWWRVFALRNYSDALCVPLRTSLRTLRLDLLTAKSAKNRRGTQSLSTHEKYFPAT